MTSNLNNGYDVMNCFAKSGKFLPHSISMPSFMAVGGQMPELDWGGGGGFLHSLPQHNLCSQNTPYILGLNQ